MSKCPEGYSVPWVHETETHQEYAHLYGNKSHKCHILSSRWEEYARRAPGLLKDTEVWAWKEIMALEIENIADTPSFVFLW